MFKVGDSMTQSKKRYISFVKWLLLFLIITMSTIIILEEVVTTQAFALLPPSEEFYVNDNAQVLTEGTKSLILEESEKFFLRVGSPQVVVLTVNNLEGQVITEYARQTGLEWSVGGSKMLRGILIVLAVEECVLSS
jgi:uncharacterized protein